MSDETDDRADQEVLAEPALSDVIINTEENDVSQRAEPEPAQARVAAAPARKAKRSICIIAGGHGVHAGPHVVRSMTTRVSVT